MVWKKELTAYLKVQVYFEGEHKLLKEVYVGDVDGLLRPLLPFGFYLCFYFGDLKFPLSKGALCSTGEVTGGNI